MTAPPKHWELNNIGMDANRYLQSSSLPPGTPGIALNSQPGRNLNLTSPLPPSRPPRPNTTSFGGPATYGSAYGSSAAYSPYGYSSMGMYGRPSYGMSGMGYGSGYGGYGMNSYGGYQSGYGASFGGPACGYNDAEGRFIQYAEECSRSTFQNVESIVRAFSSISMMLDNTFFAMTSSFRAVLSVTENFGRLRSMFGHIWTSLNIFRLINYLYKKMMGLLGYKVPTQSKAWNEAIATSAGVAGGELVAQSSGSGWPVIAFLGFIVSVPYLISKFLPNLNRFDEDRKDPKNWKAPGAQTKAAFDFIAAKEDELSVKANELVTVAPQYIQEEMNLSRTGWCYCVSNDGAGLVPYAYLKAPMRQTQYTSQTPTTVPPFNAEPIK